MSWKATAYVKELRDGLTMAEKLVLMVLADYHRTDGKNEWPSIVRLAAECLVTENAVQKIVSRLVVKGFLRRESGGGRGNVSVYEFAGLDAEKDNPRTPFTSTGFNETPLENEANPVSTAEKPRLAGQRNKVLQDSTGYTGEVIPPDLHPLNYAAKLLEEVGLPDTFSNKEVVVASLRLLMAKGKPAAAAYEYLLARALDAKDNGVEITKFWFEDSGRSTKGNGKQQVSKVEHRVSGNREVLADLARNLVNQRAGSDSDKLEDGAGTSAKRGVRSRVV